MSNISEVLIFFFWLEFSSVAVSYSSYSTVRSVLGNWRPATHTPTNHLINLLHAHENQITIVSAIKRNKTNTPFTRSSFFVCCVRCYMHNIYINASDAWFAARIPISLSLFRLFSCGFCSLLF